MRRADHSSRGILPTVVRRCVWSRNLKNEEAMARVGPQRHRKQNVCMYIYVCMCVYMYIYIYIYIYTSTLLYIYSRVEVEVSAVRRNGNSPPIACFVLGTLCSALLGKFWTLTTPSLHKLFTFLIKTALWVILHIFKQTFLNFPYFSRNITGCLP